VEEAAAAAQSLQDQATSLSQIVGVFKIDSNRLPHNAGSLSPAPQRTHDVTPKTPSLARKQETPRLPAARTAVAGKDDDWEQF